MTNMDLWTRKIVAYLGRPPFTVFGGGPADVAGQSLKAALGPEVCDSHGDSILDLVRETHDFATGLRKAILDRESGTVKGGLSPQLIHPITGAISQNAWPADFNPEDLQNRLGESITQVREQVLGSQRFPENDCDRKRLFLALWRRLPDVVRDGDTQLKELWDVLPADPRVPAYSFWDQCAVAAAIAGAWPKPALFMFDLASVQTFLAVARRTHDVWMGSYLPSYLMWHGARVIAERFGPDCLIYPMPRELPLVDHWLREQQIEGLDDAEKDEKRMQDEQRIATFTERFLAIVPESAARHGSLGALVNESMANEWQQIADGVREAVEKAIGRCMTPSDRWKDQEWERIWGGTVAGFLPSLGTFWVACPWGQDSEAVLTAYQEYRGSNQKEDFVELLTHLGADTPLPPGVVYPLLSRMTAGSLAARKMLRDFSPSGNAPPEDGVRLPNQGVSHRESRGDFKCSLCGLRPIVRPSYAALRRRFGQRLSEERLLRELWISLGELSRDDKDSVKLMGRIRQGERLCAVCLIRRLGLEHGLRDKVDLDYHMFPSTASVAVAPFKKRLLELASQSPEIRGLLEAYVIHVRAFLNSHGLDFQFGSAVIPQLRDANGTEERLDEFARLDGQWLYTESFALETLRHEYRLDMAGSLHQQAIRSLAALLEGVRQHGLGQPSRYLALLAMDGDHLGRWVQGNPDAPPPLQWAFHADCEEAVRDTMPPLLPKPPPWPMEMIRHVSLSTALRNFSHMMVRRIVELEHCGMVIYSGGDDVLAFVPVEDLLTVMKKLRQAFQGRPNSSEAGCRNGFVRCRIRGRDRLLVLAGTPHDRTKPCYQQEESLHQGPTASTGVAVFHNRTPLARAVEEATTLALKKGAKEQLGRDAFEIHVSTRGGDPLVAGMKWFRSDVPPQEAVNALTHVQELVRAIRSNAFSPRLAADLEERKQGLEFTIDRHARPAPDQTPWWHEAQQHELTRLIARRSSPLKQHSEQCRRVACSLQMLLQQLQREVLDAVKDSSASVIDDSWSRLAAVVRLARFLANGPE